MKTRLSFIIALLLVVNFGFTQEKKELLFTHGPYLQNVTETAATIVFSTNKLVVPGVLIKEKGGVFKLVQNSNDGLMDVGNNIHKVRIEDLQPGQRYEYRLFAKEIVSYRPYKVVFGQTLNSGSYSFKTFNPDQEEVNFTVFCDIHDQAAKLGKYLEYNDIEEQDCYFMNGDIMGHIEEESQLYSSFLDTCVHRFASEKPFFYARGNHETRGKFARELIKYLDLPQNKYYYAQTIGNTRFIILDGGEDKPDTTQVYAGLADFDHFRMEELEWLKNEIDGEAFKNAGFKVVIIHMPIIQNEKNWHGMAFLAKHFGPVLKDAGIDLMISGHIHRNEWIEPDKSGFGYPVLICSNNNFIEATANKSEIKIKLMDQDGKVENEYVVQKF